MMLPAARQSAIVSRARADGTVKVTDLAPDLGVSEMTIRRDIESLVDEGLLQRVHGGATLPGMLATEEPGFDRKLSREEHEKEAIARAALCLVQPGSAIGLSAGTTTWRLAKLLAVTPGLTIVTNSIQLASLFYHSAPDTSGSTSVILTGGARTPSDALVGPIAISALRQLHLDVLFMGVHGMEAGVGYTTPNMLEAETNRAFMASARTVAVLADHGKWGTVGMSTIAPLASADILVTDDRLPARARETLETEGVDVRLATPKRPPRGSRA